MSLAVALPVLRKIEQVSRSFRQGRQPVSSQSVDKLFDIRDACGACERTVLIHREWYELDHEEFV